MSSPQNPLLDPLTTPGPSAPPPENPPWSGWDVLRVACLAVAAIVVCLLLVTYAARQLFYPHVPWPETTKYPELIVLGQLLAYVVVLGFIYATVRHQSGMSFWRAIRWNWPLNWGVYLFAGMVLSVGLQVLAHFLPMPKSLPIDRFFQTTREAYILSVFGVTLAPLLEELFFRGLLYPVLVRRVGVIAAVVLTSASFGLIHAPQLGRAWGPVLVICVVGLVLTITRALTKSVAAGLLIHMAYNGTITVLLFFASDHFRHLEKLNQ